MFAENLPTEMGWLLQSYCWSHPQQYFSGTSPKRSSYTPLHIILNSKTTLLCCGSWPRKPVFPKFSVSIQPHIIYGVEPTARLLSRGYFPVEKKNANYSELLGQFTNVTFETIGVLSREDIEVGEPWDENEHLVIQVEPRPKRLSSSKSICSFLEERWVFLLEEERRRNPGDIFDVRYTAAFRAAISKLYTISR